MNSPDDARRLRDRQDEYDAELAAESRPPVHGTPRVVARTITDGRYPTQAGVVYKLEILDLTGDEVEGGAASRTLSGRYIYAAHIASSASMSDGKGPDLGTDVEAVWIPYRWIFFY